MSVCLYRLIVVNASSLSGGYLRFRKTPLEQFLTDKPCTGSAQRVIDFIRTCCLVSSANNLHRQTIFLGNACQFIKVNELRLVCQICRAQFKEK